jgi:hypothetical protein
VRLERGLDRGLDLDDPARDLGGLLPRRTRQQRADGARAGRVADVARDRRVAVGDEPEHDRVRRIDVAPERAREPHRVEALQLGVVHQQPNPRVERGLGELDSSHVGLRDAQLACRPPVQGAIVQYIREGAVVGDHAWRTCGRRAVDRAVAPDDAGEKQLRDHFDHTGSAHTGHAHPRGLPREARFVRPRLDADHLQPRLERGWIDAHAFDRTGGGALAARQLRAFERGTGRARRGIEPLAVAEHDLGVGADVDDTTSSRGAVLLQHRSTVSAPTCPAMHGSTWRCAPWYETDVARPPVDRLVGGQGERRGAERVGSNPRARWCMIGLPTSTTSTTRSAIRLADERVDHFAEAGAIVSVRSRRPDSCSITYDTRLIRSSPNRICGFMIPADATTSPVARSQR